MALALDGSAHNNQAGGAASVTATLTTTNADDIIVVVVTSNGGAITSITDDDGLTWNSVVASGGASTIELWYAIASSALSADNITANIGSNAFMTIDAFGISGGDTANPIDDNAGATDSQTTGHCAITTDLADTFIVGGYRFASTGSPTEGTGFTLISGADFQLSEYQIVSATQSALDIDIGTGDGNENGGVAAAFRIAQDGAFDPANGFPWPGTGTPTPPVPQIVSY